jgi:hypothetical protein
MVELEKDPSEKEGYAPFEINPDESKATSDIKDIQTAAGPNALDAIQEFMENHWMEIRLGCAWGSALLFIAFIGSSTAFKRHNTLKSLAALDRLTELKFRVFIAHVDRDPDASELNLYAFHTPWLRNFLGMHPSKLSLESQTWKIRLVGVSFPRGDDVSEKILVDRFYRKSFIVRFVDVPEQHGNCLVYKTKVRICLFV